ncbi:MAG: DUF3362 domain-containing protein [Planctomycetaceae bacterium]|nr:DUF3362 domain-containing protein [Planctomycetaceae bacterium]
MAPTLCPHLNTDHSALVKLLQAVRNIEGINKVFISSGVRTDLALLDERYIQELIEHHTGGYLSTAPEHTDPAVLELMNKPTIEQYDQFCSCFTAISNKLGKDQYIVPYLMAGFPGTTLAMTIEAAVYLKRHGIRSDQVQEFVPGPFELATCMYYTGLNPITGQPVYIPFRLRERRLQKALLMYHDPNNYHDIKSALKEAGREDLIGTGEHCLIAPYPPKSLSMRQSSRVKRLQIKNIADKKLKEERRTMFAEQLQQEELERQQKRREERLEKLRQEGKFVKKPFPKSGGRKSASKSFGKSSDKPSAKPFGKPSDKPSGKPFGKPSDKPSGKPFGKPSDKPSGKSFGKPSGKPSGKPFGKPSDKPSGKPFGKPSGKPSDKQGARKQNRPR